MPIASSCIECGARTPDGASRCPDHQGRRHRNARPCIACAKPTRVGDYCSSCSKLMEAARQARREATGKRDHYKGTYPARARKVRKLGETGKALCWLCGRGNYPGCGKWSAEHVIEGDPASPLMPTHLRCNIARENRRRANAR